MADNTSSSGFSRNNSNLIHFRSFDNSSNASEIPEKKRSRDNQIIEEQEKEVKEPLRESEYVDRSAQISATLNSLAVINAAKIVLKNDEKNKFSSIKKDINIFYGSKD